MWHVLRDTRGVYRAFVGRREGERPLGRNMHIGEDNIKRIFRKLDGEASYRVLWLRVGTGGWLL
jgi:hypothetical protein